jgi:hypothetical protein
MTLSWNIDTDESIEFDAFVDYFKAQDTRLFEENLDESARMMRKICNNREFLTDKINTELGSIQNLKTFQSHNLYTPQVFILHSNSRFFVRANIWEPLQQRPGEGLFFYERPHDHNFAFLTVGYLGSGYRTRISEYDAREVVGYVGEAVRLKFLEETGLPHGKVMYFRQSIDVHTQLPPDELSISLNVLKRPADPRPDQYAFDLATGKNLGKIDRHNPSLIVRLAGVLGDDNSIGLITDMARTNPCRRTRLSAFETLASRQGPGVWAQARDDRDELVQTVAAQRLAAAESEA